MEILASTGEKLRFLIACDVMRIEIGMLYTIVAIVADAAPIRKKSANGAR